MPIQTSLSHPAPAAADQRTLQILTAVRRAFAEKGFDGASMQDLARAAEMSVGNFYRYFPSKAAIVEALVTQDLVSMEQDFAAIIGSPNPMQVLRDTLQQRITATTCAEDGSLWAEMTAASLRKPEIGAITSRMEAEILGYLVSVFSRTTGLPAEAVLQRFAAHAQMIVMLVKACNMQPHPSEAERANLVALVMRTIDGLLDEIRRARLPEMKSRDL